jgi:hypothetical protein
MRNQLFAAGVAAALLIPSFAMAQQTCEQQRSTRTTGTIAGAGIGALLGSAVAGHNDRAAGAVIGGVGGAIIGNQVAKGSADCAHAYGFYDAQGAWHSNGVARADATGYYDRQGAWVNGAPNGYYTPQGRWVTASSDATASGYYDSERHWVPASATGYYDARGQWVAGAASGYYDAQRRWVAGPAVGRYDANGRWIPGQPSMRRDSSGAWVAEAQTGYYDSDRRWHAGPVSGYYDNNGRWTNSDRAADSHSADASYETRSSWAGAPADIRSRQAWLDQRIRNGVDEGRLSAEDGDRATRTLAGIRRQEARMPHRRGQLSSRDTAIIQARLDDLSASLRWSRRDGPGRN